MRYLSDYWGTDCIHWARQGMGITCVPDLEIAEDVKCGKLARVLTQCVPNTSGLFLYLPTRTQNQSKMRALIEQVNALATEGAFDVTCKG